MTLKHQYDKKEDIPETYRELFTEKSGKWELTGVTGVKTQADVDRVQAALEKERGEHKEARAALKAWSELGTPDDVHAKLDRLPELEAAAKGKLDEAQIEQLVEKRVEGVIKSRTAPLERQLAKLQKERDELDATAKDLVGRERTRKIHDAVRSAATAEKLLATAVDDALVLGERVLEIDADGNVVTRDGVGVTPGLGPKDWLGEVRDRRPHWWPASVGGGAPGSGGRHAGANGKNPWSRDAWNITEQGRYLREHGADKAAEAARAAGSSVGSAQPPPAKQQA